MSLIYIGVAGILTLKRGAGARPWSRRIINLSLVQQRSLQSASGFWHQGLLLIRDRLLLNQSSESSVIIRHKTYFWQLKFSKGGGQFETNLLEWSPNLMQVACSRPTSLLVWCLTMAAVTTPRTRSQHQESQIFLSPSHNLPTPFKLTLSIHYPTNKSSFSTNLIDNTKIEQRGSVSYHC